MYENKEDQEALEVIARLDERMNLEHTDVKGERTIIIHSGYGYRHLFEIEKFVKDIVKKGQIGGFVDETSLYSKLPKILDMYFGNKYYRDLNKWLDRHCEMNRYSARVEAFYDVCKTMGLIGRYPAFEFGSPEDVDPVTGIRYMDWFNALIEQVYSHCQGQKFKERERLRIANAERNRRNVLALEEALFSEETGRSRWLILSLTLRYKPENRHWITPEIIQQHRNRFLAARRSNKLMSGIKTPVWAIEQGKDVGLHLHVILFYSAASNHDEHIAMQIGEYWKNVVTDGMGDYWNSNDSNLKEKYEKYGHGVGVGQINRNDFDKRSSLRLNLEYLAKSEQYLMIKFANGIRTFGMGQVPKKKKSGRPRTK